MFNFFSNNNGEIYFNNVLDNNNKQKHQSLPVGCIPYNEIRIQPGYSDKTPIKPIGNYLKDADTLQCPDTLTFNLVTAVQPVIRKVSIKGGELNMYIPNTNGTLNMLPNTKKTYKNFSYTGVV